MRELISIDPLVCHGQACVKGTRLEYAADLAEEQVTPIEALSP